MLRRPWETDLTSFTERTSDRTMVASMWCPASPAGMQKTRYNAAGGMKFQVVFAALSVEPAVLKRVPSLQLFSSLMLPKRWFACLYLEPYP